MKEIFIKRYYDFFDKQIWDSTIVVWLIWFLIFFTWFISQTNLQNVKSNILESNKSYYKEIAYENVVIIDWKKYKIIFKEVK